MSISTTTTTFEAGADLGGRTGERGVARPNRLAEFVTKALSRFYLDKRGNVSRPKLLFTVAVLDLLAVVAAGYVAAAIATMTGAGGVVSSFRDVALAIVVMALLHRGWSYTVAGLRRRLRQMLSVTSAVAATGFMFAGISYLLALDFAPAVQLVLWMVLAIALLGLVRVAAAASVERLAAAGRLRRRTIIVGGGAEADELITLLAKDDGAHLEVLGVFDDRERGREAVVGENSRLARLGTFAELAEFCQSEGVDLAIVTVPTRAEERLLQVLHKLFVLQVDIRVSALNSKIRLNPKAYNYIGKVPMLAVMDKPLSDWDRVVKNVEDRVLAALMLVVLSPVMLATAIAVKATSKGPILFKQRRYGFNNELIEVYKFRSMFTDMSDATASKLVTKDDPRVTPVGRVIRKTSLDELPQLINVIKGEMSLVGPRPHATQAKAGGDLYEDVVHGYFARHRVKPGVTGWAQVNGWRGETDTQEKIQRRVELDLQYIDRWSVAFDLYIIALTPFVLLTGKNAY
ncbi:MAG: undecaprenyl-phosphate glucose phosphotransferase [Hyphomicrobiaceae bacterium]|nr:undecaprenyl-phosphate glucose phosphotransferase [Hyphomicrobiaceae bacterium]